MKDCPRCGKPHEKPGTYCSYSCANKKKFSAESSKKKSIANKKHWEALTEEQKQAKGELFQKTSPFSTEKYFETLMINPWDELSYQAKRLRVILEQDGHCNKCGLDDWNVKLITLEFEHMNGINTDNRRENVECLCPNCHSQTPTWRGRNTEAKRNRQKVVEKYLALQNDINRQKIT